MMKIAYRNSHHIFCDLCEIREDPLNEKYGVL